MGYPFEVTYSPIVVREHIPALSPEIAKRIQVAIEEKLRTYPAVYGKPLRYGLKGYRVLRVGNYRVIFILEKQVRVIGILHRSKAYREMLDL